MRTIQYIIYISLLTAATLSCAACKERHNDGKPVIYVSIASLKPLVQDITCGDFDIEVLVPSGASPESFEPTPKQFIALSKAEFVFNTGLIDFEQNILGRLSGNTKVVPLHGGIELIEGSCSHHHGDGCRHNHGTDPHIWCSPKTLKVMAHNIFEAVHAAYPDSVKYEAAYAQLDTHIDELDNRVAELCAAAHNRYFLIYHPALTYLARDYGLEQISVEHEGKEPSAKRLAGIIEQARRDNVRKIFYQRPFPRRVVEALADDIEAEPVEIDPLGENAIENIEYITRLITEQ